MRWCKAGGHVRCKLLTCVSRESAERGWGALHFDWTQGCFHWQRKPSCIITKNAEETLMSLHSASVPQSDVERYVCQCESSALANVDWQQGAAGMRLAAALSRTGTNCSIIEGESNHYGQIITWSEETLLCQICINFEIFFCLRGRWCQQQNKKKHGRSEQNKNVECMGIGLCGDTWLKLGTHSMLGLCWACQLWTAIKTPEATERRQISEQVLSSCIQKRWHKTFFKQTGYCNRNKSVKLAS